jgi:hypothetical protein
MASHAGERTHMDVRAGKRFTDDCLQDMKKAAHRDLF